MNMETDMLDETYYAVLAKVTDLIAKGADNHVVAAALIGIGASIYRTTMTDTDYNSMMTAIYDHRALVQRLTTNEQATMQ